MADEFAPNKYSMVEGAARRARQLYAGSPPLGVSTSTKASRVAEDEIRAGKVTFTHGPARGPAKPVEPPDRD